MDGIGRRRQRTLFAAALAANLALPALCLLWRHGVLLFWPLMIVFHILLGKLNIKAGPKRRGRILLCAAHMAATAGAHLLFAWLWNTYAYGGHPDNETVALWVFNLAAGLSITLYQLIRGIRETGPGKQGNSPLLAGGERSCYAQGEVMKHGNTGSHSDPAHEERHLPG